MILQFLVSSVPDTQADYCRKTAEFLKSMLSGYRSPDIVVRTGKVTSTEPWPDLVHTFGVPAIHDDIFLKKARRLHIPIVNSPLGVANVPERRFSRRVNALHACSILEQQTIKERKYEVETVLIPNALVTSAISPEEMAHQFFLFYEKLISRSNREIKDKHAKRISEANNFPDEKNCEKVAGYVLEAELLIARRRLTHQYLYDFSNFLKTEPYDEDHLNELLLALKTKKLTSRLLQIMSETAQLTEGFMPFAPVDDLATKQIRSGLL